MKGWKSTSHCLVCLVFIWINLFIVFEASSFFFFSKMAFLSSLFYWGPTLQYWNSGRSEWKLCQALAGWELPVFWSIGRLGATALVPRYSRAPFGSQFYRWSQTQGLTYTIWQWLKVTHHCLRSLEYNILLYWSPTYSLQLKEGSPKFTKKKNALWRLWTLQLQACADEIIT